MSTRRPSCADEKPFLGAGQLVLAAQDVTIDLPSGMAGSQRRVGAFCALRHLHNGLRILNAEILERLLRCNGRPRVMKEMLPGLSAAAMGVGNSSVESGAYASERDLPYS